MAGHSTKYSPVPNDDADIEKASMISYVGGSLRRTRRRRPLVVLFLCAAISITFILAAFLTYSYNLPSSLSGSDDVYGDWAGDNSEYNSFMIQDDPTHVVIQAVDVNVTPPAPLLQPLTTRPPLDQLIEYYAHGTLNFTRPTKRPQVDLVTLFVNASSDYFAYAKNKKSEEEGLGSLKKQSHHWRDNGELRGGLRSFALSLRERLRTIHVVSAAFDFPDDERPVLPDDIEGDTDRWQLGQIPEWLDWASPGNVQWHFHSEIFRLPRDEDGSLDRTIAEVNEEQWRSLSLPNFNSFEIESRIPFVNDLSPNFILSNDDMFLMKQLSLADFHHPLLGPMLRPEPGLKVGFKLIPEHKSTPGEWGGLNHANILIGQRFVYRDRWYLTHMPKAMTQAITQESEVMFASVFTEAATRCFRESRRGRADVEMAWLWTWLQIERWREALLWTWAVARLGGEDGMIGEREKNEIRDALGLRKGEEYNDKEILIKVTRDKRETFKDVENYTDEAGWEHPLATRLMHTSLDGALPPTSEYHRDNGKPDPNIVDGQRICRMEIARCFPKDFFSSDEEYSAVEVFKLLTFLGDGRCGDCMTEALLGKSGKRGLSAFLPSVDAVYFPPMRSAPQWSRPEPMLPLTPTWQEADFSMEANVRTGQDAWEGFEPRADGGVSMRAWTVKLLSRYAYVYARTESRFNMIHNVKELNGDTKAMDESKTLAMACINDDVDKPENSPPVQAAMREWMERRFGEDSEFVKWEKSFPWN